MNKSSFLATLLTALLPAAASAQYTNLIDLPAVVATHKKTDIETIKQCAGYFHYFFTTFDPANDRLPTTETEDPVEKYHSDRDAAKEFYKNHRLEAKMRDTFRAWAQGVAIKNGDLETDQGKHDFALSIISYSQTYKAIYVQAINQAPENPDPGGVLHTHRNACTAIYNRY